MSTIADYSVFTKAFLAANNVDFSQLYGMLDQDGNWAAEGSLGAFAVIPSKLTPTLTPREAMNLDSNSDWSKFGTGDMWNRVSCRDAKGNFIGNIVRVQPGVREGSIRLVAKVAIPVANVGNVDVGTVEDISVNTFVLVRTDPGTKTVLPIAVATISKGYTLHKHLASGNDPLDDVENANYVSFTINNLNGYTSVDFNPDAYATYDDVANALSRGIDGLHIAFNSNTGDIILSDSKGNVIDQVNLHIDADTIIAEGEEGYKYVKTDINQDIHSAKAFMDPVPEKDGSYYSAFGSSDAVTYDTVNASLVRYEGSPSKVCNGIRVRWVDQDQTSHDEIFYVYTVEGSGNNETETGKKYLAWNSYRVSDSGLAQGDPRLFHTASGALIEVPGDSAIYSGNPDFTTTEPVYDHDVFVHTVGNSSLADWDECFELMGFHDGDDIPLGTDLPALMQKVTGGEGAGYLDPEEFIHGADANNAAKVVIQRERAKDEMLTYNSRHPGLRLNTQKGTIIDSSGLDIRNGRITLGCGRVGADGAETLQKVNYGIQMKDRSSDQDNHGRSESLDFTISQSRGVVGFDGNGHATGLTSSTLLSIEAGSYISGAPTCLILAEVTHNSTPNSEGDSVVFTPVRMTAGFSVEQSYSASSGLTLTLHDYRDNIAAIFVGPNNNPLESTPAIIEVQAIYTHQGAPYETVPAQQMHTYIGEWVLGNPPSCSFLCNKIEEWMTAVGLADTTPAEGVQLYVVIRVY